MNGKAVAAIALTIIIAAPILIGYGMNFQTVQHNENVTGESVNITDMLYNSTMNTYADYNGLANNQYDTYGLVLDQPNYNTINSTNSGIPTHNAISLVDSDTVTSTTVLNCNDYDYNLVEISGLITCKIDIVFSDSTTTSYSFVCSHGAIVTYEGVTYLYNIDVIPAFISKTWTNVNDVTVTVYATSVPLMPADYKIYKADSNGFGQYAEGWKANNMVWSNLKTNGEVDLILQIPTGSSTTIQMSNIFGNQPYFDSFTISRNATIATLSTTDQSKSITTTTAFYRLIVSTDKITLDALAASSLPPMGSSQPIIASVSVSPVPIPLWGYDFGGLIISDDGSITYRVDNAKIVSGTYSTINNASIDASSFAVEDSYQIKIKAMTPGSSLTIGSTTYTINNNGAITIGGRAVSVKDLTIRSISNGSTYTNTINGYAVNSTAAPAQITMGGNWSATVGIASVTSQSVDSTEWVPGGFAFDFNDFALMGIIITVIAFIGLGLYARGHGSKSLLPLLAVCAGAGAVFIIIL